MKVGYGKFRQAKKGEIAKKTDNSGTLILPGDKDFNQQQT